MSEKELIETRKELEKLRKKKKKLLEEYLYLLHKEDEIKKVRKYII